MAIKIAHECPLNIFYRVQELTDYDYALVHLFEESEEYYNKFLMAKMAGREIILDNSIFELGEAFDAEKYAYWIEKLKPDWYIVPDSLENKNETISNYENWIKNYNDLPGKKIGVVQGKNYDEAVDCYKYFSVAPYCEKVAISFDYSFYETMNHNLEFPTKYHAWCLGRQVFLDRLIRDDWINYKRPHHLLGCSLPQEFLYYKTNDKFRFIESLDTSNPVVAGLKGIVYNDTMGLDDKPSEKLYTMIESDVSKNTLSLIEKNIDAFRRICNELGSAFQSNG